MNDIPWDGIVLTEFRNLAHLTEFEDAVLQDWVCDRSIVQSHFCHYVSSRTVDRAKRRIRAKYDAVQPFSPLLPKRMKQEIPPS